MSEATCLCGKHVFGKDDLEVLVKTLQSDLDDHIYEGHMRTVMERLLVGMKELIQNELQTENSEDKAKS